LKNDKTDFTQGSILKKLALFMLPILGALVLQAAYGAVDLLVVGRFGSTSGPAAAFPPAERAPHAGGRGKQRQNVLAFSYHEHEFF